MILVVITKPEKQPINMAHTAEKTNQRDHNDDEKEQGWDVVDIGETQEQCPTGMKFFLKTLFFFFCNSLFFL